jgi:hypothetical protein
VATAKRKRDERSLKTGKSAAAQAHAQTRRPPTTSATRNLLAKALQQAEDSTEERQAFSLYLKALHDVHAK